MTLRRILVRAGGFMFAANIAAWGEIERSISGGQQAYKALKYAPFPVVAAPAGMALGGGCEPQPRADCTRDLFRRADLALLLSVAATACGPHR